MEPAQYGTVTGSANTAHRPPMVCRALKAINQYCMSNVAFSVRVVPHKEFLFPCTIIRANVIHVCFV